MLVRIDNAGESGIIRDPFAPDLSPSAWTSGANVRFKDGYAVKSPGYASTLGTPTVAPYGTFYAPSNTVRYFAYFGLAKAYSANGSTQTSITRQTASVDVDYTGTADDKWVGGMLSGILVVTNGVDAPQSWVPGANLAADLANWPASTTCATIRPFKGFLIALDVTKSGTRYPFLVKWSHPADPGAVPTTWDETDTTKDAGEIDLADTSGEVIDGGALGDVFIVWKANATYALRYVGPPFIFQSQKVTEQSGILAQNCWCETPRGLVVLTLGDVVLQAGDQPPQSIIDGSNRAWLFDNLNPDNYQRSFLVHNEEESEVLVCFPSSASEWCDTALVWNYVSNTWGVRTLPAVSSASVGYVAPTTGVWSAASDTWSAETDLWTTGAGSLSRPTVVIGSATNTAHYAIDGSETAAGTAQTTRFERVGLHFDAPDAVKLVKGVRPVIDGTQGDTVSIYVGSSFDADATPTWTGPYTFTVGSTIKVDCLVSGRYIGVRYESAGTNTWRVRSWSIDVHQMGGY